MDTATMHHVFNHMYGDQERRIFLIPHRLKDGREAEEIKSQVLKVVTANLVERKLNDPENTILPNTLTFTELIEFLMHAIQEAGYIYNRDLFLGIDFQEFKRSTSEYIFDEYPDKVDAVGALRYYLQIANTYNPLILMNPFKIDDLESSSALTLNAGETTLVCRSIMSAAESEYKDISEKQAAHCVVLRQSTDLSDKEWSIVVQNIKRHKLKAIIECDNQKRLDELNKYQPDFIIV